MGIATLLCKKKEPHKTHTWRADDGLEYACPGVVSIEAELDRLIEKGKQLIKQYPDDFALKQNIEMLQAWQEENKK